MFPLNEMSSPGLLRRAAVFHAVVQAGGMTAAAPLLGKSVPAISVDLKRFQRDVGTRLIERGNNLRLTPAGRILAEAIARSFNDLAHAFANARRPTAPEPLRLGVARSVGRYVLIPRLLSAIAEARPVRLSTSTHDGLVEEILTGEIDLMLSYRRVESDFISSLPTAREELVLVGEVGRDVTLAALEQEQWVTYSEHEFVFARWFDKAFGEQPRILDRLDQFDDLEEALISVKAGRGITIAPLDVCQSHGLQPNGARTSSDIYLCGPPNRLASEDALLIASLLDYSDPLTPEDLKAAQ